MARQTFNDDDDSIANSIPHKPVARFACAAGQCPMPGTIFTGSTGLCVYHVGAHAGDWHRITRVLVDWQCVMDEINAARRAHCSHDLAGNPDALERLFGDAWKRLQPMVAGAWEDDLKPGAVKAGQPEDYREWGIRLERFIGQRVVEILRKRLGAKAA